jgi:TPR repeat protein
MVETHMTLKFSAFTLSILLLASAGVAAPPNSCAGSTRLSDGKNFALSSSKEASGKSLDELTCGADRGDPSAQLALGVRYEKGEGVAADPARAARLYAAAERTITRLVTLNSPPVRSGQFGTTRMSGNRPLPPALAEVRYRLGRLYWDGRGVKQDRGYGRRLLIDSARQDYAPAIAVLKGEEPAAPDTPAKPEEALE